MWMALIISHKSARAIVVETVLVVDLQLNLCEVTLDLHGKAGTLQVSNKKTAVRPGQTA